MPQSGQRRSGTQDLIHVCPLSHVETMSRRLTPSHLVTLINSHTMVDTPEQIAPERHLRIAINDIAAPQPGLSHPTSAHVEELLRFVATWDRRQPILIHCLAGISRSTAGALIVACALHPEVSEMDIAHSLRRRSPTASPNRLLIHSADTVLGRGGRMIEAVRAMGPAEPALEAEPFSLPIWR